MKEHISISFLLKGVFSREGPVGAQDALTNQERDLSQSDPQDKLVLGHLANTLLTDCSTQMGKHFGIYVRDFYAQAIVLGETAEGKLVQLPQDDGSVAPLQDLVMTYKCKDQWALGKGFSDEEKAALEAGASDESVEGEEPTGEENIYDSDIPTQEIAITFFVFSQLITIGFLQGTSITAFYTGTVLSLGFMFRPIVIFVTPRAFIYEITYPDPILRLVEAVHMMRTAGDLVKEEENYRLFVEILRSPELLKNLTGSSLKAPNDKTYAPSEEEFKKHHYILKAI